MVVDEENCAAWSNLTVPIITHLICQCFGVGQIGVGDFPYKILGKSLAPILTYTKVCLSQRRRVLTSRAPRKWRLLVKTLQLFNMPEENGRGLPAAQ